MTSRLETKIQEEILKTVQEKGWIVYMHKKKSVVTVKKLQSFLASCKINPNNPGPFKVILEADNPDYYETRAIEFIYEAQALTFFDPDSKIKYLEDYEDKIRKAIGLLSLAALMRLNKEKE